jgi:hypothetical protein
VKRLLPILVTLLATACGAVSVDYIDFIQHGDIQYVAAFGARLGRELTEADLGPEQFRVKEAVARAGHGGGYMPRDGDAAFVPTGDPVYAVRGYKPSFRLAARHDGRLVLYEADSNPAAKTGADLLDIEGRVASIALLSPKDGLTVIGRISDPARVAQLVGLVVTGPVGTSHPPSSGPPAFVAFELMDGTATTRAYFVDTSTLSREIKVGQAFHDAIVDLLARAPTPSPVPATVNLARRYDLAAATRVTIKQPPKTFVQDASLVARFAAALDTEAPAFPRTALPSDYAIVVFEFADHYVSLAYDAAGDRLTVVTPDDGFAVRPPPAFRELLR